MGSINFTGRRGETFDRTFTWWTVRDVTPRDLTGYALRMQIRSAAGGILYTDLSIGSGITLVTAASGIFRVVIAAAVTAAWTFDEAKFDLKATDAGGLVSYPIEGSFFVVDPVTA